MMEGHIWYHCLEGRQFWVEMSATQFTCTLAFKEHRQGSLMRSCNTVETVLCTSLPESLLPTLTCTHVD